MTTSTINVNVPSFKSSLSSAPIRANFAAAASDINALWTASDSNAAAALAAQSTANTGVTNAATAQATANTAITNAAAAAASAAAASTAASTANTGWTKVSTYGNPTGTNDTATIQAAYTAAIAAGRKLLFDVPLGWPSATVDWYLNSTPNDNTGALGAPATTSVNTSTGLFTFDRAHNLSTGDVIGFAGSPGVGSGGGLTQVVSYTEYFFNKQSSVTGILYNSRANAIAGGATGKYIPASGNTTTAVMNTVVTTTTINNGSTTATVTDASKLIIGDRLNLTGNNAGETYPTISNIVGNDLTFSAWGGSTVAIGSTIWTTSIDVASTMTLEAGSTLAMSSPGTANSFYGDLIVKSIVGSTVHVQLPPNYSLPTPGATQTLTQQLWIDPKYLNIKFEVSGAPGVILRKTSGFSGNALLQWFYGSHVYIHDIEMWGKNYGYTPDPAILAGDDGIRVLSGNNTRIERVIMKNFGDAALRFNTSTYWAGARSTTFPNAGVYSNNISVKDSYFFDCFQFSTTASGTDYQGGSHNVIFANNFFQNIGGSIKFANRAPGGANLILIDNIIETVGRDAFELDSYTNLYVSGNTITGCAKYGIFVIANDLQPIGFSFDTLTIKDNIITAGSNTVSSSSAGGIFVNPDLYPDGTRWNFRGMSITGNKIYDMPAAAYPINVAGGAYLGANISDNILVGNYSTRQFNLTFRVSATSGLDDSVIIKNNIATNCLGTKTTMFYLYPTNGAAGVRQRGIWVDGNKFDSTAVTLASDASNDGRFLATDYIEDLRVTNNVWRGYGGTAIYIQTEGKNFTCNGNDLINLNTVNYGAIQTTNTDGIKITNNHFANAYAGTSLINLSRTDQNVRIFGNDYYGSTSTSINVGNIPIKTSSDALRRIDYVASIPPSAGTWGVGDQAWLITPTSGNPPGTVCTAAGSYSAITATADSDGSTAVLTAVSNTTNLSPGTYFTHPGFTGTVRIVSVTATTITASAASTSIQVAQAITVANPTFKAMAAIA